MKKRCFEYNREAECELEKMSIANDVFEVLLCADCKISYEFDKL